MSIRVPPAAILKGRLTQQPRQFMVLGAVACLLALSVFTVACNDLPSAPKEAEAAQDQVAQLVLDSKVDPQSMSDRELLLAVLGRLDDMEARMENGGQASSTPYVMTRARIDRTKLAGPESTPPDATPSEGQGQGPPEESPSPQQPQGVPQQLAEMRTQLEDIQGDLGDFEEALELAARRTDTVMVVLGMPAPTTMDETTAFSLGSSICLSAGREGSLEIKSKSIARGRAYGRFGIDFYGNQITLGFEGKAQASSEAVIKPLAIGLKWTTCFNVNHSRANELLAALPFKSIESYEADFGRMANRLGQLADQPLQVIRPQFNLFDSFSAPGIGGVLRETKTFFDDIKGTICTQLSNDFDIVEELNLSGKFIDVSIPFKKNLGTFQERFNSKCGI